MTPLAGASVAARRQTLLNVRSEDSGPLRRVLARPAVVRALTTLAVAELGGDKFPEAPERTVPAGMIARAISGGIVGATVAPRTRAVAGALLGAGAAVAGAQLTHWARSRAMRRHGQIATGVVEDVLVLALVAWVIRPFA
jgi:uncharacterized membrane protein